MKRLAKHSRRVIVVPIVVEPVVVPVPPITIPVQIPDVQVAIGIAVM